MTMKTSPFRSGSKTTKALKLLALGLTPKEVAMQLRTTVQKVYDMKYRAKKAGIIVAVKNPDPKDIYSNMIAAPYFDESNKNDFPPIEIPVFKEDSAAPAAPDMSQWLAEISSLNQEINSLRKKLQDAKAVIAYLESRHENS